MKNTVPLLFKKSVPFYLTRTVKGDKVVLTLKDGRVVEVPKKNLQPLTLLNLPITKIPERLNLPFTETDTNPPSLVEEI